MSFIDTALLESINKIAVTDSIKISLLNPEVASLWDDLWSPVKKQLSFIEPDGKV